MHGRTSALQLTAHFIAINQDWDNPQVPDRKRLQAFC